MAACPEEALESHIHRFLLTTQTPFQPGVPIFGIGVFVIGEDAIQQIGQQAAICLAESHTQAPARKLLSQVLPLHQRVRSLLDGRLRLSKQRELYRIESLLLSHACLLLGDMGDAARRRGRDAAGCVSSRCRVAGGSAEGPGDLGADTRRRGDSASAERVA
jgi:hypothetical protein